MQQQQHVGVGGGNGVYLSFPNHPPLAPLPFLLLTRAFLSNRLPRFFLFDHNLYITTAAAKDRVQDSLQGTPL